MLLTKYKDDLQLIERFFERELTEQELADFEVRLTVDNDFAERVERFGYAHEQVEQVYYSDEHEVFKRKWAKILDADEVTPSQNVKSLRYYLVRVAAAILFILGLALIVNQFGSSNDSLQQLALQSWKQSEIGMSKKITRNIFGDEPDALFWKGNCYFELRQMSKAISHFEAVIQHKDGGKKDLALWYQVLAYLYENDTEAARKNLNTIIENEYPKARDAARLLEKL